MLCKILAKIVSNDIDDELVILALAIGHRKEIYW